MHREVHSLLGLTAAKVAAAIGRAQRGHQPTADDLQLLEQVAQAAQRTADVLNNKISYWDYRQQASGANRMFEAAVLPGWTNLERGLKLTDVAAQLRLFTAGQRQPGVDLTLLHDLFALIAQEVNASYTSSGERFTPAFF